MKYLLGIDFGGGAAKATLINTLGDIVAENMYEYPTYHPTPDACEQRAEDWIDALCKSARNIIEKSGIFAGDILAVALDSATHTSLVCDDEFRPLRPAIHWTDSRSKAEAKELLDEYGEYIFEKTYHKPDPIWTLPQLIWLYKNEPECFDKIKYIFFEKDYIRRFLTGTFCTDYIEAQGSMMFDCTAMKYDEKLCALAHITPKMLPPVMAPTDIAGYVTDFAASATGLCVGTPVICGTTDTCMEVFASGAVKTGDVTVKLATAGRICVITDRPHPDRHLVNYSHIAPGRWYPGTATKAAASSYRWYRDTFGSSYDELNIDAEKVPVGCDGLMFLPHINGELTPYADPTLCGSFTGIRSTHTRGHFTRAVLEGVALSLLDCKKYLKSINIDCAKSATLIGGGSKGELWSQITADALDISLITTRSSDSSLGSAMLAGIAVGVFSSAEDAAQKCVKQVKIITPDHENHEKYEQIYSQYKAIHDALAPIYAERKL